MTQKQTEQNGNKKVYLTELKRRHLATKNLILRGRGLCLVEKRFQDSQNAKPEKLPVCSVFEIIAKYLAMPGRTDGSSISPYYATAQARRMIACELRKSFELSCLEIGTKIISVDVLVRHFISRMENEFGYSSPRDGLSMQVEQGVIFVRAQLIKMKPGEKFLGGKGADQIFEDDRNLIKPITAADLQEDRTLKPGALRMLKESLVRDFLLAKNWEPSIAEQLIVLADEFARKELASATLISCGRCGKYNETLRAMAEDVASMPHRRVFHDLPLETDNGSLRHRSGSLRDGTCSG